MQAEIEAKFLDTDFDVIRNKLVELGAECVTPMRLMRRKVFDFPDGKLREVAGWVRVRDEGDKVTLSYKQLDNRSVDGTKEISVVVSSFDGTADLLEAIGLTQKSYQETRRESWVLDGAEIELDEWPWINQYVEIEAVNADTLFAVAEKLGFDKEHALHGSVEIVYSH